jgi:hypothetical protein
MGGRVGVPTITCHSTALPCPRYNYLTDLLEIQMKDIITAVVIGLALTVLALAYFDILTY